MEAIRVKEIASGYACYFPIELKESFKSTFKSAKWDSVERCWKVGPRSKKRLDQWVELALPAAQELAEVDVAELTEHEIAEVTRELTELRVQIVRAEEKRVSYERTIVALVAAKDELAKAKARLEASKREAFEKGQEARQLLANVCDLNVIAEAQHVMQSHQGKSTTQSREAFKEAQRTIRRESERLLEAGFISQGLLRLTDASFNRPDRDSVVLADKDLYDIKAT